MRHYRRGPRDLPGRLHHLESRRRRDMQYHVGERLCVREHHRTHAVADYNTTAADNYVFRANNDVGQWGGDADADAARDDTKLSPLSPGQRGRRLL